MKTNDEHVGSEHQLNNYDTTIYHAMCVQQDFTNGTNAGFYNAEELALEVV